MRSTRQTVLTGLAAGATLGVASLANAQECVAPTPVVPAGLDSYGNPFDPPGDFPSTISAANWTTDYPDAVQPIVFSLDIEVLLPLFIGGADFDTILDEIYDTNYDLGFDAFLMSDGPLDWATGVYGVGDNDPVVGVFDPSDPLTGPQVVRSPDGPQQYGWIPSAVGGAAFHVQRANGRDNEYQLFLNLPPAVEDTFIALEDQYYLTQASIQRGGGAGYSIITGEWDDNSGGGIYFSTNLVDVLPLEGVTDTTTFFLPYCEGWVGGWFNHEFRIIPNPFDPAPEWITYDLDGDTVPETEAAYPGLPAEVLSWNSLTAAEGVIDFTSLPARSDIPAYTPANSMIFMNYWQDSDNLSFDITMLENPTQALIGRFPQILNVLPVGDTWELVMRVVGSTDTAGIELLDRPQPFEDGGVESLATGFSFAIVPFDGCEVIGGHVNGLDGTVYSNRSAGTFDVDRIAAGRYAIQVTGADYENSALLLQVAGDISGAPTGSLPDRTVISYEYDPTYDGGAGAFIVQTTELISAPTGIPLLERDYRITDSSFYFAFFDFANPFQPVSCDPGCPADLDPPGGDGALGFFDLVAYLTLFAAMDPAADLDPAGGDGAFGFFDLVAYLTLFAAGCP